MTEKFQGLADRVIALEKAIVNKLSGKAEKEESGEKSSVGSASAPSRIYPEHGVFPDSPPIFAVDEADAEAALGIRHGNH
jgi:hypothetical protein